MGPVLKKKGKDGNKCRSTMFPRANRRWELKESYMISVTKDRAVEGKPFGSAEISKKVGDD